MNSYTQAVPYSKIGSILDWYTNSVALIPLIFFPSLVNLMKHHMMDFFDSY